MSDQKALNLHDIDPPIWRVLSGRIALGPYTLGQLQRLINDKQLTPASKVSNGDGHPFLPAAEHAPIQQLFRNLPQRETAKIRIPTPPKPALNRYLLVFYGDNDSQEALLEALNTLGDFGELVFGTFVIKSTRGIADMQKQIASLCARDECFILVEANSGRLAWFGVSDDISGHIRNLWKVEP